MEQTLGKRIVSNRKRLGMTQDMLAEKLGVTAQAVSKWENDQSCPDIAILPRLAEIFGISTDELLGRETPPVVHQGEVVDEERKGLHIEKDGLEFHWDSGRTGALITAILVLAVGVLTLLSTIYAWDVSFWSILWPSALLALGVNSLLRKFSFFGLGCLLFGGYFLGSNLHLWQFTLGGEIVFPAIVVLFGISLLVDAMRKPKKNRFTVKHKGKQVQEASCYVNEDEGTFSYSSSFSETTHAPTLPRLSGGSANVSFGELVLDLRNCAEIADDCNIDVSVTFGNLELMVPRKYRVKADVQTAFGASDFTGIPDSQPEAVIHVSGSISFGNLEIRYI